MPNRAEKATSTVTIQANLSDLSGSFFYPQPPSLLILLSEPGSEEKSLLRKPDSPY